MVVDWSQSFPHDLPEIADQALGINWALLDIDKIMGKPPIWVTILPFLSHSLLRQQNAPRLFTQTHTRRGVGGSTQTQTKEIFLCLGQCKNGTHFTDSKDNDLKFPTFRNLHGPLKKKISLKRKYPFFPILCKTGCILPTQKENSLKFPTFRNLQGLRQRGYIP